MSGKLTVAEVKRLAEGHGEPGRKYRDAAGLFILVGANAAARWILRLRVNGRPRDMGLGAPPTVTLAMARELAERHRRTVAMGGDPIAERQAERVERITFEQFAKGYIESHRAGWKNPKHAQQWPNTMRDYVYPKIGNTPIDDVDTPAVLGALEPIWALIPETAKRVRGRIEMILSAAKAQGLRTGENPALWRGHLDQLLVAKAKLPNGKVEHHPAVPVDEVAAVFKALGKPKRPPGVAAAAVQFAILTAVRPGNARGARWSDIDLDAKVWTIPGPLMKGTLDREIEHRVPLSEPAMAILKRMATLRVDDAELVFPGAKKGRPLSDVGMNKALRLAGGNGATVHGTARSTFDDWATERTKYTAKMVDTALAHREAEKTRAAYRRTDMLEQRRPLMADWAAFLSGAA